MYITDSATLARFCTEAATAKVIGVDTEFVREKTYYPKLCLIQVATTDVSAAIDPLALTNEELKPLSDLLFDGAITKVFHACAQDLEVLNDRFGAVPSPVFDTQLAAAFLGHRMQLGYGALVDAFCGIHLPKADSLTDWQHRPLDTAQLHYAEDDARYLPRIYDQMQAELLLRGRLGWLEPEMAELVKPVRYQRDKNEAYQHLKRVNSLTRRQLAIAREVAAWREETAAQRDIPRKRLLADEVVIAICQRRPRSSEALRRIRGTELLSSADTHAVAMAVVRGCACDPKHYPAFGHRHERPPVEAESVLDLMNALLRLVSKRTGVAVQLIATREELYDYLRGREGTRLSSGWRYELAGEPLKRLLNGEIGLTVKGTRVELL